MFHIILNSPFFLPRCYSTAVSFSRIIALQNKRTRTYRTERPNERIRNDAKTADPQRTEHDDIEPTSRNKSREKRRTTKEAARVPSAFDEDRDKGGPATNRL